MKSPHTTPWHKVSFDHFLHRSLPDLLTSRVGLAGYRAEPTSEHSCRIVLQARSAKGEFEVVYPSLPVPDEAGVFRVDGVSTEPPSQTHPTLTSEEPAHRLGAHTLYGLVEPDGVACALVHRPALLVSHLLVGHDRSVGWPTLQKTPMNSIE